MKIVSSAKLHIANNEDFYPKMHGIRYISKIKLWIHPHIFVIVEKNSSVFQ